MANTVNQTLLGCPADCDDALLYPAIPEEQDCPSYAQGRSQICYLYLLPTAMGSDIFASWGTTSAATPSYVANSIDNTVTNNSKAKQLTVIGELPVPEVTETEYPLRRTRATDKAFTLQATYYQLDDDSYEFLRQLKCGQLNFTFYYGDLANYVYGIAGGLVPTSVRITFPKGNGKTDKNTAVIRLGFRSTGSPQRRANPLAA